MATTDPDVLAHLAGVLGWSLLPCFGVSGGNCECGDVECAAPGKHPMVSGGVKSASDDVDGVRRWAENHPTCNWAVACGQVSGIVVIDIDPRHGGGESFDQWELDRRRPSMPETTRVRTGGGGIHIVYSIPDGRKARNRVNWLPGVDVRGDGGYVILPGSNHVSGAPYEWDNPGVGVAVAPDDLLTSINLVVRGRGGRGGGNAGDAVKSIDWYLTHGLGQSGERDINTYKFACSLWRRYWNDPALVESIVGDAWRLTPQEPRPFTWREAKAKIDGARAFVGDQMKIEREVARNLGGAR